MNEQALLEAVNQTMPFGKYKDIELRKIPSWYRSWLLNNISWNPMQFNIRDELNRLKSLGI